MLFKKISTNAVKNNLLHIPLYYFDLTCNLIIKTKAYPKILQDAKKNNKNYSIILYELAEGDLMSFINKNIDTEMWKNIYEQVFMSIFILHNMGYIHNDTHRGNFLYRKINKGGCFHYKINGNDYYIKNLGILWMIWDFGNSRDITTVVKYNYLNDYYYINALLCHRNKELEKKDYFMKSLFQKSFPEEVLSGYLDSNIKQSSTIKSIQEELYKRFLGTSHNGKNLITDSLERNMNSSKFIKLLADENILFSKTPIGKVISSSSF